MFIFNFLHRRQAEAVQKKASPLPSPEPPTTSSYLVLPDSNKDCDANRLRSNVQLSLKYAFARHDARGGTAPDILQVELPEHLRRGISEWLSVNHATGTGLEVSAVLLRPSHSVKATHDLVNSAESRLLSLPPEMRNRIYRFSLVDAEEISIDPQRPPPIEPALLRTCSQIRKEASGIYYKENKFEFVIVSNDASLFLEWSRKSPQHKWATFSIDCQPSTNWPNLMVWLKAYHDRECWRALPDDSGLYESLVTSLWRIADVRTDWVAIEKVLNKVRKTLAVHDPGWLDDQSL